MRNNKNFICKISYCTRIEIFSFYYFGQPHEVMISAPPNLEVMASIIGIAKEHLPKEESITASKMRFFFFIGTTVQCGPSPP